jgi:hypothetical protein
MFKIILILVSSFSVVFAQNYIGCGTSEKEARDELAKTIFVTVDSTSESNQGIENGEVTQNSFLTSSKQTTLLKLTGLKIYEENEQVCAKVSKNDLVKLLKSLYIEVKNFDVKKLPNDPKSKKEELKKIVETAEAAKNLATIFGTERVLTTLTNKYQDLLKLYKTLPTNAVKFNLPSKNLKIYIDGSKRPFYINQSIYLKSGKHQYLIKSKEYCDILGEFELEKDDDDEVIIDDIDLENWTKPKLTFTTNQDPKFIKFTINNDIYPINQEITFNKCEGQIVYRAEYMDKDYSDVETGSLEVSPALVKKIHLPFLSLRDIVSLKKQTKAFTKGDRVELLYSFGYVKKSDNQYLKNNHNFAINFLEHRRFFRFGYGAMFGTDKIGGKPNSKLFELYYQIAVQFSSFGDNDLPLRIGKFFSFIPYAGIEFGAGYHEYLYRKDLKVYQYPRSGDDDAKKRPEDYDDFNWKRDFLVVRPIVGVDFILSKGFAFKIYGTKELYIDNRWFFGTGLSIEF